MAAAFERVRGARDLAVGYISLGLDTLLILRIRSPEPRHLQSISSAGTGCNEWRDAQAIPARRVSDNTDRFATPVHVGTIDPVALTAIRIGNRQHDVDAALPNRDNGDFTRSQVENKLMMVGR